MPRRLRLGPAGFTQHIVQRGNNRHPCFTCDNDMKAYAHWLHAGALKYQVQLHAWVFMTNHVHLLATPLEEMATSRMMQFIGRHYVRYFNFTYDRTGTLWEGRFYSSLIQANAYLLACQRYIELNPVRAGIVAHPGHYGWSSYHANGLGVASKLRTPHPAYRQLGRTKRKRLAAYRALFATEVDAGLLYDIRYALRRGLVLGNERFKAEIAACTGRRVEPLKRGRPCA